MPSTEGTYSLPRSDRSVKSFALPSNFGCPDYEKGSLAIDRGVGDGKYGMGMVIERAPGGRNVKVINLPTLQPQCLRPERGIFLQIIL